MLQNCPKRILSHGENIHFILRLVLLIFCIQIMSGIMVNAEDLPRENVISVPATSDGLYVSNLFQSDMVIQREKPIKIWGWASPGETVTVVFAGNTKETEAADDRSWSVSFDALKADTKPQTMLVKGKTKSITLKNILIGDVWVLGGQSNMEFPISRVEMGALEIASANFPEIRLLTVPVADGPDYKKNFPSLMEWSDWHKSHSKKGYWEICTPESVYEFSAIGYVFARRIHKAANVPIGVIDASQGGTLVEAWTPDSVLRNIDSELVKAKLADWDKQVAEWDAQKDLEERKKTYHARVKKFEAEGKDIPENWKEPDDLRPGPSVSKHRPGNCYAGMIGPLEGLAVKGAIFHQGYNNCFEGSKGAEMYYHIFPQMITAWRAAFKDPLMPFGILSLCTAGYPQTRDNFTASMFDAGPYIREAQYKTFLDFYNAGDKHVGFVSTFNLRRRWYHPQLKVPAGERIARWALATQYGFDNKLMWKPPMITEMTVKDGTIILKLDSSVGNSLDGPIEGFAIAGEDRKFHPANVDRIVTGKDRRGRARGDNKSLVLSSPMVQNPIHYRYAWARNPMANVEMTQGRQPPFTGCFLATQRSDNWGLNECPIGVLGDDVPEELDRMQSHQIRQAMQALDKERKLKEAELFIEANKPKADSEPKAK